MFDYQSLIVLVIGFALGSGIAFTRSGPYFFFYLTMPILGAVALTLLLGWIDLPGFKLEFDRVLPKVLNARSEIIMTGVKGFAAGSVLQWLAKRLFVPERRKAPELAAIDASTPMKRRQCLAVLGLPKNAGPRDIMLAWSKLSSETRKSSWPGFPLRRRKDPTKAEYRRQVDEAYQWLIDNPQKDGMIRPVKQGLRRPA